MSKTVISLHEHENRKAMLGKASIRGQLWIVFFLSLWQSKRGSPYPALQINVIQLFLISLPELIQKKQEKFLVILQQLSTTFYLMKAYPIHYTVVSVPLWVLASIFVELIIIFKSLTKLILAQMFYSRYLLKNPKNILPDYKSGALKPARAGPTSVALKPPASGWHT